MHEVKRAEALLRFHIENMSCGGCAKAVTKIITTLDPKAEVDADTPSKTVTIQTSASQDEVQRALAKGGWIARNS
jgi:copper chaperone